VIYVVLDQTDETGAPSGKLILVPYGAFVKSSANTVGSVDVSNHTLTLNLASDALKTAPTFTADKIDLTTGAWESQLMGYWSQYVSTDLSVSCTPNSTQPVGTPGAMGTQSAPMVEVTPAATGMPATGGMGSPTAVKLASRDLLKAQIEDKSSKVVGQVQDLVMNPESGLVSYLIVRLTGRSGSNAGGNSGSAGSATATPAAVGTPMATGTASAPGASGSAPAGGNKAAGSLVLVPLAAVTIKEGSAMGSASATQTPMSTASPMSTAQPGGMSLTGIGHGVTLVLLVDTSVLEKAPTISAMPNTAQSGWDTEAFTYWKQYVQITQEQLP
jgi:hypothetical protein